MSCHSFISPSIHPNTFIPSLPPLVIQIPSQSFSLSLHIHAYTIHILSSIPNYLLFQWFILILLHASNFVIVPLFHHLSLSQPSIHASSHIHSSKVFICLSFKSTFLLFCSKNVSILFLQFTDSLSLILHPYSSIQSFNYTSLNHSSFIKKKYFLVIQIAIFAQETIAYHPFIVTFISLIPPPMLTHTFIHLRSKEYLCKSSKSTCMYSTPFKKLISPSFHHLSSLHPCTHTHTHSSMPRHQPVSALHHGSKVRCGVRTARAHASVAPASLPSTWREFPTARSREPYQRAVIYCHLKSTKLTHPSVLSASLGITSSKKILCIKMVFL